MSATQKLDLDSLGFAVDKALDRALELGERGIQVAVYVGNDLVIDAWAGVADENDRPVDHDTTFNIFSTTKAATSVAAHLQVERGLLDYDEPIATYWPEFAKNGKDKITIGHVLAHQSGIPQMPSTVTPELMSDWDWMIAQITEFVPYFEPGTDNGYQAIVFGWLVGETVRRTDPAYRPFDRFLGEEVFGPLGIKDFWLGVPDSELDHVATLTSDLEGPGGAILDGSTDMSLAAKPEAVALDAPVFNQRVVRQGCLPGAGGIASARSVARLFALLANEGELNGVRLLSAERVRRCLIPRAHSDRLDKVLVGGNRWSPPLGIGGLWLGGTVLRDGPGVLCHAGLGNSIGYADLDTNIAVGITHNRLFTDDTVVGEHPYQAIADIVRALAAERA